jgi:hypothetical protein
MLPEGKRRSAKDITVKDLRAMGMDNFRMGDFAGPYGGHHAFYNDTHFYDPMYMERPVTHQEAENYGHVPWFDPVIFDLKRGGK